MMAEAGPSSAPQAVPIAPAEERPIQPHPEGDNGDENRPSSRATVSVPVAANPFGRLKRVWNDLLFSDKGATAVSCLHVYGYLLSIIMTVCGGFFSLEYVHLSVLSAKLVVQLVGLVVSCVAAYASAKNHVKILSFFFVYELLHLVFILTGSYYLLRTSKAEIFEVYTQEPIYNMKLVDQPFFEKYKMMDVSSEPAYEVSLLNFRAMYMLVITFLFHSYALYALGRRLCHIPPRNQRTDHVQYRREDEGVDMRRGEVAAVQPGWFSIESMWALLGRDFSAPQDQGA